MSLIFEQIQIPGVAVLSYFIADSSAGTAAVVDPTLDTDRYLVLARKNAVAITHVFETHIHADFVSGARELARQTGTAQVHVSQAGRASYGFPVQGLRDGQTFRFGAVRLTARHTPGHTPEHVSFLLSDEEQPDEPWGVLTGDSLFVGSAGRPDLLGDDETEELTQALHRTLQTFYGQLPDHVIVYPGHGAGSPCGADIGDRLVSTIGFERRHNTFLKQMNDEAFRRLIAENAPPVPTYYARMKRENEEGPAPLNTLRPPRALTPSQFEQELGRGEAKLVDTRDMLSFGGAHIANSLNIGGQPLLSLWAGWLLNPDRSILLVLPEDTALEETLGHFHRTGYRQITGYLAGGITAWQESGRALSRLPQLSVHDLQARAETLQVLDVRTRDEWNSGHVPSAKHVFLPELSERARELDREQPVAVYCGSGYRASIGASLLLQLGFKSVFNVPGSWTAWTHANLPVARSDSS